MIIMSDLFAEINGIKICYEIQGEGEPVFLIHGFASSKMGWIAQFGPLSEHFKVIRVDSRGVGKSDRPNIPYTLSMLADDIKGLMDYLKIEKASLIGWSLGGMTVQKFALKYPDRVNKLILLVTTLGTPDEKGVELLKESFLEVLRLLKEDPAKAFWQKARLLYRLNFRKQMEANPKKKFFGLWSVEDLIKISTMDPCEPQDVENLANAMKIERLIGNLEDIKAETLLVAASHDRITPKATMEEMCKILPNCTYKLIENAGHCAPLSRAPEVNKMIIDFL